MDNEKNQWDELLEISVPEIKKFLKLGNPRPIDYQRVKIAMSALSNITRHEATESAKEGTRVIAARLFSKTPEEVAEYLRVSTPSLQLPEGRTST